MDPYPANAVDKITVFLWKESTEHSKVCSFVTGWTQWEAQYYHSETQSMMNQKKHCAFRACSLHGKFQGESKGGKVIYNIFPIKCLLKNGKVVFLSLSCSADFVWGRRAALAPRKFIFPYVDMSCDSLIDTGVLQYLVKFGVEVPLFCPFSLQTCEK